MRQNFANDAYNWASTTYQVIDRDGGILMETEDLMEAKRYARANSNEYTRLVLVKVTNLCKSLKF